MRKSSTALLVAVAVLAVALPATGMQAERFLANAIAMGNVSGTSRIEFMIERWTTDEERAHFLQTLAEGGQEALIDELQHAGGIGRVRVGTRLSYPISYAYQFTADDGSRRIILATDRPIGALEAIANTRTVDYAVSLAELRISADGEGEGALLVGAEIVVDHEKNTLSIENYGQAPVRLNNVRNP